MLIKYENGLLSTLCEHLADFVVENWYNISKLVQNILYKYAKLKNRVNFFIYFFQKEIEY